MNTLAHNAVNDAKLDWYREVLALEPNSKVFLPFARLLGESKTPEATAEALDVLRRGLQAHPEYLDARLYFISLLHEGGFAEECGAEVAHLAGLFRNYPSFWDTWSALEVSPDFSAALGLLGLLLRDDTTTFASVLSAGLKSLRSSGQLPDSLQTADETSFKQIKTPVHAAAQESAAKSAAVQSAVAKFAVQPVAGKTDVAQPVVVAVEYAASPSLAQSVAESVGKLAAAEQPAEQIDESAAAPLSSVPLAVAEKNFVGKKSGARTLPKNAATADIAGTELPQIQRSSSSPHVAADSSRVATALADSSAAFCSEKCSVRTRSMADVLAEQGDFIGAIGIYEELLQKCAPEKRPALQERLNTLREKFGLENTEVSFQDTRQSPNSLRGGELAALLDKLAVRLETKACQ